MSNHWNPRASLNQLARHSHTYHSHTYAPSRPVQPWRSEVDWLSAEDYRALSPHERRALQFRRLLEDRRRANQPPQKQRHFGHWLAAAISVGVIAGSQIDFPISAATSPPTAASAHAGASPHAAVVRASFSSCKWGGGANCVVDGDTFWIGGEKVRIAGIDAPETHDYGCASELALGDRATDRLQALLNSGAVTMSSIDRDRDVYGRLLRNVQVDGADVGEAMVGAGVAREYAGGRRPWC